MAERRMFAKSVVMDDKFLDLTPAARCLYFALGMAADDDGFVGSARRIMYNCGANKAKLQSLIDEGYVRLFPSGVVKIVHWEVNNQLRKDRYHPTVYTEEKAEEERRKWTEQLHATS